MPSIDAFDLSTLTPRQTEIVVAAVKRCTFDFTRCLPRLRAEKGRERIPVTYEDLSRYTDAMPSIGDEEAEHSHSHTHDDAEFHTVILRRRVLGLAWYSGKITLEMTLTSEPNLAQEVFLAEAAHMVDFFVVTPEQREQIFDVFHGGDTADHGHGWFEETGNNNYWSWVGESWMAGFIRAYSDIEPWDKGFMHSVNEEQSKGILMVMDPPPVTPPPLPPTPLPPVIPDVDVDADVDVDVAPPPVAPEDFPYFATKKGKVFHDSHRKLKRDRVFLTREAAVLAGLRPCTTCKP